ncbi:hypothetical protein APY94_04230 [Thermococcus celericrescens]|uniref:Csm1 subunit domain-containing protein n=1 Tax=Thermococcus celericrescens TaxID=227598 RepID=A0A100XYG2_9EURY|nr:hypothetical protein [Thermococcus celericrescens]KUH33944.1 hypothetical protein APY94_04230 [Thermococcus celericrescens]
MYYRPQRLDFRKGLPLPEEKVEVNAEEYRERIDELAEELRGRDFTPEPSAVMAILETYTTFLPACSGSAVSFYDSARMVAALATALYLYWREEESGATSERPFLLVEGDLSGIQRFIFSITSKGALKHLRARSVYLDLLGWDVVLEIIKRLGLTRASVLYNGGGSFTIIAPNTKRARETLKEIRKELETFLLGKFDGSLYLAIDWLDVSPEEIRDFKGGPFGGNSRSSSENGRCAASSMPSTGSLIRRAIANPRSAMCAENRSPAPSSRGLS